MRIKKGDTVQIISGKDKGKKGLVVKAFPQKNSIIVENVNLRKKHVRPKKGGEKGQRVEIPLAISVSSAMLICKSCGKATRVRFEVTSDGAKKRICKKCKVEA